MQRHVSADIVLHGLSLAGEGDLLQTEGDPMTCSTEQINDSGDCGSGGDSEDASQDDALLPLAGLASPPPR